MFTIHKVGGKAGQQQWGVFSPDNILVAVLATQEEAENARDELRARYQERKPDEQS